MIVAVDLGAKKAGIAWGTKTELLGASCVRTTAKARDEHSEDAAMALALLDAMPEYDVLELVIEWPQKYPTRPKYHDDIQRLWDVGWALMALTGGAVVTKITPAGWAGQVPKGVRWRRAVAKLSDAEQARVPDQHDARDAVQIYLWAAKRARRGMV